MEIFKTSGSKNQNRYNGWKPHLHNVFLVRGRSGVAGLIIKK